MVIKMKYYAVIDTNVLVSAMLKKASVPDKIMQEVLEGDIIPLLNKEILKEYGEVLARPKFKFPRNAVAVMIAGIIKRSIFVDATPLEEILPDAKDVVFYEVVMEGRKSTDAYLITGNLKHFPARSFVVTPKEMLEIIEDSKGGYEKLYDTEELPE